MTLSVPDGLIRALRENRLPAKVEVWHAEQEEWVSLSAHPAARKALESISSYLPAPDIELIEPVLAPVEVSPPEPVPEAPPALPEEPVEIQLAAAHEFIPPPDPSPPAEPEPQAAALDVAPLPEILPVVPEAAEPPPPPPHGKEPAPQPARTSHLDIVPPPPPPRQEERRSREVRPSIERRRPPAPPPPPPDPLPEPKPRFKIPVRQILIGGGVLALIAGFYVVKNRKSTAKPVEGQQRVAAAPNRPAPQDSAPAARESVPAEVPPPLAADSADTAPHVAELELQGLPGGGPESDLETRLRLADALMWNPSQDFNSPGQVLRSRRKVDAVLNSIQAYRVDMRRMADSTGAARVGNRMEPFDEASRIDDVIRAMGEAVGVLEDVAGRFTVRGGTLEFDRADDARRYNDLRDQADSLLRAPVPMDLHPIVRPPRRFVSRLVSTLPGGMSRGPSSP